MNKAKKNRTTRTPGFALFDYIPIALCKTISTNTICCNPLPVCNTENNYFCPKVAGLLIQFY